MESLSTAFARSTFTCRKCCSLLAALALLLGALRQLALRLNDIRVEARLDALAFLHSLIGCRLRIEMLELAGRSLNDDETRG